MKLRFEHGRVPGPLAKRLRTQYFVGVNHRVRRLSIRWRKQWWIVSVIPHGVDAAEWIKPTLNGMPGEEEGS